MNENGLVTKSFEFFIPIDLIKSDDDKWWIQGVASTDDIDLHNERVFQDGIDLSYFLSKGYFNDNHKEGVENIIGEPTYAEATPGGLFVKGYLYKNKERARYWWNHLQALEQENSSRRVGMSIQGKTTSRIGNEIMKCWLTAVAITANPVNTSTWAQLVKSLDAHYGGVEQYVDTDILDTQKSVNLNCNDLTFEEAIKVVQLHTGWSRNLAQKVVKQLV